jgi:hypothetical protein
MFVFCMAETLLELEKLIDEEPLKQKEAVLPGM